MKTMVGRSCAEEFGRSTRAFADEALATPAIAAITFARPEYAALAEEFGRLMQAFGHEVDAQLRRDIARLAAAIERIDRCVDAASDDGERRRRWALTVNGLGASHPAPVNVTSGHFKVTSGYFKVTRGDFDVSAGDFDPRVPDADARSELADAVSQLRALAVERGVLDRIRRIVGKEARTSEAIRAARQGRAFLLGVEREGRLTAALALVIAGDACDRAFRRFFFRLGAPANIVDKILDAREDHARGEMTLPPSASLYVRLVAALVVRGVALIVSCKKPIFVVRLGLRYLVGGPS